MNKTLEGVLKSRIQAAVLQRESEIAEGGDEVVAEVTRSQVYAGLPKAKVLVSGIPGSPHYVTPKKGLHISGRRLNKVLGVTFEELVVMIFTGLSFKRDPEKLGILRADMSDLLGGFQRKWLDPQLGDRLFWLVSGVCADTAIHPIDAAIAIVSGMTNHSRVENKLRQDLSTEVTWEDMFLDSIELIALLGILVPMIWQKLYRTSQKDIPLDEGLSFSQRFYQQLGLDGDIEQAGRVMDALFLLMSYHGPGNVSTLTATTAASSFTHPWGAFTAMAAGLRGVNHGGAAEMGAYVLLRLVEEHGLGVSSDELAAIATMRLTKEVRPGWCVGHRLLRCPDPRTIAQKELIEREFPGSRLFAMNKRWEAALTTAVATYTGAETAEANVDFFTGVTLNQLGIITRPDEAAFAAAVFMLSRSVGALAEVFGKALAPAKNGGICDIKPALFRPAAIRDSLAVESGEK